MPHSFSFNAHIISIIDPKRICVRIDNEDLDKVSSILSTIEKRTVVKHTLTINVSNCRFTINQLDWDQLSDLIGVNVIVNATYRNYDFWRVKETNYDDTNQTMKQIIKYKGTTIVAKKITNVTM